MANKKSIKLYNMLQQVTFERVANSAFWIPDSRFLTFHKPYKNMADGKFTFLTVFSPFFVGLKP